ncbi:TfoX/Sxy family protein [Isoptericola sp. NEAU-Y5]|uniref:TfoX/Sxy family protein n=1 Tax=Isoptericola luteus TaxID=2879484 RepID=A0ABS7ZIW6_9MICO|nr:TfoX/Sxy family protein [Isoptericola sp. NEAU-Y5]MCA5894974.1 TfoX/Sxy family protein [Isoptericola sp. NEAU-Y5]
MAYDEELAARVRDAVGERAAFTEQKMFGGVAFMVNTHMAVGIGRDELMVHVGTGGHEAALADGAQEMRMGERTMRGMVSLPPGVTSDDGALRAWVDRGVDLALATPPKTPKR